MNKFDTIDERAESCSAYSRYPQTQCRAVGVEMFVYHFLKTNTAPECPHPCGTGTDGCFGHDEAEENVCQ